MLQGTRQRVTQLLASSSLEKQLPTVTKDAADFRYASAAAEAGRWLPWQQCCTTFQPAQRLHSSGKKAPLGPALSGTNGRKKPVVK